MKQRPGGQAGGAASIVATLCLALATSPVMAQSEGETPGVSIYAPEAFADSAPQNAEDMLDRVPGFVVVEADADVRGYAGAQGNVLIDGARPGKREDIGDILSRIPASAVERIELIRVAPPGVDMAGHAVLANVVRRRDALAQGATEVGAAWSGAGRVDPLVSLEYARQWGDRSLDLAASYEAEVDSDSGPGRITARAPDGVLLEDSLSDALRIETSMEATPDWSQPFADGELIANAALRAEREEEDARFETTFPAIGLETVFEREDYLEAEAGLRFSREIGPRTRMELVASQQLRRLEAEEGADEDGDVERFTEATDTGESIARIDLTHEISERLTTTFGLEGAFNFLESQAALEENGAAVLLPGSDVRITERRGEVSAGAVWRPREGWALDASLRLEASAITQTGDTPLTRSFFYSKPRIALSWERSEADQLRLAVSREVGQLDFGDFVAGAALDTGQVSAGNASLEPDSSWRLTASWEHRFGDEASVTITWTHDEIEDVIDRVLIVTPADVFDAPGNIGDGRRDTLAIDATAPLDRLGLSGGLLAATLTWRDSEVTDPVTGERRAISEEIPFEGSIELTQDLPAHSLSWGVSLNSLGARIDEYRFDEVSRSRSDPAWSAFIERRFGLHWRLKAEVEIPFGRDFETARYRYDGPRSTEPVEEIETREHEAPALFSLTLRRSWGG